MEEFERELERELGRSNSSLSSDSESVEEGSVNSINDGSFLVGVKLNSIEVESLWDSGSSHTMIPERVFKLLNTGLTRIPAVPARTLTGGTIELLGTVLVDIWLGKRKLIHVVSVCRDDCCPYDCLLGLDFQRRLGSYSVDFEHKSITVPGGKIALRSASESELVASSTFIVPACSALYVPDCHLRNPLTGPVLIEPRVRSLEKRNLMSYNSVNNVQSGRSVPFHVLNMSPLDVTIYRGTKLADCSVFASTTPMTFCNVRPDRLDLINHGGTDWDMPDLINDDGTDWDMPSLLPTTPVVAANVSAGSSDSQLPPTNSSTDTLGSNRSGLISDFKRKCDGLVCSDSEKAALFDAPVPIFGRLCYWY